MTADCRFCDAASSVEIVGHECVCSCCGKSWPDPTRRAGPDAPTSESRRPGPAIDVSGNPMTDP